MKKIFALLVAALLGGAVSMPFAGCAKENDQSGDSLTPEISDPADTLAPGTSDPADTLVDPAQKTAEGIDKNDPYTWFDANKEVLPSSEECRKITAGMSLNEVITRIGKPQRDVGYGAVLFQFDVMDGSVFTVAFARSQSGAALSDYDGLVVDTFTFDMDIPDIYFPQQTTLRELFPWMKELREEEISEVRCEKAAIGVEPFLLKDITYSTAEADIRGACRLFSSPLHAISQSEGQVDGGGYVKYDFVAQGETYSVTFSNHNVLIDRQYYRFDDKLFDFLSPDKKCHSFITYPLCDAYEIDTYEEESVKISGSSKGWENLNSRFTTA